jgi:hypothetical protein
MKNDERARWIVTEDLELNYTGNSPTTKLNLPGLDKNMLAVTSNGLCITLDYLRDSDVSVSHSYHCTSSSVLFSHHHSEVCFMFSFKVINKRW